MTSTVLDLTVTPFNYPVVLGFGVGTGPSETRSVGDSLHLQKGLCRLSLATTVPAFHSFFPLLQADIINSLGHVSPFIYFFVCFFVFTET